MAGMKLLSIQVGKPRTVDFNGKQVSTGIFKDVIAGPVMIHKTNLDGDGQADLSVHGGVDKAVYAYSMDAMDWWKQHRPNDEFSFGAFGENLSFARLSEEETCIGDTFRLGESILQAAQPRFPCYKLGVKFKDPKILKAFVESGRPGVYFRVLEEGKIIAGDELVPLEREPHRFSILRLFQIVMEKDNDPIELKRLLKIEALPTSMREHFSEN